MIENIVIGSILLILTTVIHAFCMVAAFRVLRHGFWKDWSVRPHTMNALLVSFVVLVMFFASLAEIGAWTAFYLAVGAFSHVEPAFYYSTVTYTTLGYGDIVLDPRWRLLGSFQATNGIIMFGWTTALIFAFVHWLYFGDAAHDDEDS